jgi:hypothetical protein
MKNILLLFALFTGCASGPNYNMRVNSYVDPKYESNNSPKTFILVSAKGNDKDLQFKEFAGLITQALEFQGYKPVENASKATEVITLDYGVDNGTDVTTSKAIPVYNNSTTAIQNSYGQNIGYLQNANPYAPSGYTHISETSTFFLRQITLSSATDSNMNWKTEMRSQGTSSDLRAIFPIILNSCADYIATNTGKELVYSLSQSQYQNIIKARKQSREVAAEENPNSFSGKLKKLFPR